MLGGSWEGGTARVLGGLGKAEQRKMEKLEQFS